MNAITTRPTIYVKLGANGPSVLSDDPWLDGAAVYVIEGDDVSAARCAYDDAIAGFVQERRESAEIKRLAAIAVTAAALSDINAYETI